jgi:uncharacterized protein (TIGR00255 family)
MIKGMTGFGSVQLTKNKIKLLIEIKTLNHRYFDVNFYLPSGFGSLETKIRQVLQKKIERGRVTVVVKIIQKAEQDIVLNQQIIHKYLRQAEQVKKKFRLENDLTLSDLINLPGVIEAKNDFIGGETLWPLLGKSIDKALLSVVRMRRTEGKSISADVTDKLRRMTVQVKKIQARAKKILSEKKKKLTDEEFKSYQKSVDVNEEISRLSHYISEMRLLLKTKNAVGKKMDFVAQEMQRETNTIGSKLQDKTVSSAVLALKSKVEKIREQTANIE